MGKALEISDMPALTPEMHDELRALERRLRIELSRCCGRHEVTDPHAAFEYARTYAIEFYDLYYGFYSQIPDPKYRPHWRPASETFAFDRVIRCIENNSGIRAYFTYDTKRTERIRRTISDHAEKDSISTIPVDTRAPNRPAVFAPIPHKRIGRSIQSEKAARRMEAYIQNKGITQTQFSVIVNADQKTLYRFRRSGKVEKTVARRIVDAMGITLEEFLS